MDAKSGVLERRLKARTIGDPVMRALVNLQVAVAHFEEDFEAATLSEGLSNSAYNVLRILRGQPDGHSRTAIAERMIYRKADLTRIIDGLVRRGLAERIRSKQDRRLSVTRITPKGLKTMGRIDPLLEALLERYRRKLALRDFQALSPLLEALYADHVD